MLQHYKSVTTGSGSNLQMISTGELVDDPCTICGGESVKNVCSTDKKAHHHGLVHNPLRAYRLEARCAEHAATVNAKP